MGLAESIDEAIEIWKQEGREEGRKEGEEKGKISSIKRILTKKLKVEPSKEVVSKLEKLTIAELECIEDKIFEIESWEEI